MFKTKQGPSQVPFKQKDENATPFNLNEKDKQPIVEVNPNVPKK